MACDPMLNLLSTMTISSVTTHSLTSAGGRDEDGSHLSLSELPSQVTYKKIHIRLDLTYSC